MPRHHISRAAIEHLKRFEGCRLTAGRLADGGWTIGYGHTKSARQGAEVSEADAEALLIYDLIPVERAVEELVFAALTQNQFDALVAFAFNIGLDAFRASSVLRHVNQGAHMLAACELALWRKAQVEGDPIVVDALVRRRSAEKLLFLTPPEGFPPSPTPLLTPLFDDDGLRLVPRETPPVVEAALVGEAATVRRTGRPAERSASREDDLAWLRRIAITPVEAPAETRSPVWPSRFGLAVAVGGLALFLIAVTWNAAGGWLGLRWGLGLAGLALGSWGAYRLFVDRTPGDGQGDA